MIPCEVQRVYLDRYIICVTQSLITGIYFTAPLARVHRCGTLIEIGDLAALINATLPACGRTHAVDSADFMRVTLDRLAELQQKPGVALRIGSADSE
jgi:hypothetical protein